MQWKGSFRIDKIVAKNDYCVSINGKVKTFHVNMLKKYRSREKEKDGNTAVASAGFDTMDAATIEDDPESEDEEQVEMVPTVGKEQVMTSRPAQSLIQNKNFRSDN